jgi:hypothetical protein
MGNDVENVPIPFSFNVSESLGGNQHTSKPNFLALP